jgi:hypothetical protein
MGTETGDHAMFDLTSAEIAVTIIVIAFILFAIRAFRSKPSDYEASEDDANLNSPTQPKQESDGPGEKRGGGGGGPRPIR